MTDRKVVDPINARNTPNGKTASSLNVKINWHHQTDASYSFFSINTEKSRKNWLSQLKDYLAKKVKFMEFVMSPPHEDTGQVLYFRTTEEDGKIVGEREGTLDNKRVTFRFDIPISAKDLEKELSQWTIVASTRPVAPSA